MLLNTNFANLIEMKIKNTVSPQWELPIETVRENFHRLWQPKMTGPVEDLHRVEDEHFNHEGVSVPVRVYVPNDQQQLPIMVYLHGGGYVKGSVADSDPFCRNLSAITGAVVVSVDYRLAPEFRCPAALVDSYQACILVRENADRFQADPSKLFLCGESAGGNLAALTAIKNRDNSDFELKAQILLQPVVDFSLSFPSIEMPENECLVPKADLAWYYEMYCPDTEKFITLTVSPLFNDDLKNLPPTLIITAEYDSLRDEAKAYADKLEASGVPVSYHCYPGMIHGFLQMGGLVSEARDAMIEVRDFIHKIS